MKIVGLEGSQIFAEGGGSEHKFVMLILHNGGYFNVPIVLETYQLLSDIGALQTEKPMGEQEPLVSPLKARPHVQETQEIRVSGQSNLIGELEVGPSKDEVNALDFMSKIGAFGKPEDILQALSAPSIGTEGSDVIEGFEDPDEEDPGEENSDNDTEQW